MSKTSPGRLSDVARRLVLPSGLTSTQWPSVRRRCAAMGVQFDQWQADLVRGALGKRADGKYAATVGGVVWSLPRQVGKTFTTGAMLFALCAETPGLLVLWTAHHTRTAGETFLSMQAMARRPKVAPYIEQVLKGAGTQAVVFRNGSRILFGARDEGFGLGFAAVDAIVFDEAQRLDDRTRMDMVPAANRSTNPAGSLLFYIGTPPRPTDKGEAFASLRSDALAGESDDMFYVELAADPETDPDDRTQWAKANPSYPHHTPLESMLRMRKHLGSEEAWRREALGIWDAAVSNRVISAESWAAAEDPESRPDGGLTLGVEVGPDLVAASVSFAGRRSDGDWHIELDEQRAGADWLPAHVERLVADYPSISGVVGDVGGPLATLVEKRGTAWFFKGTKIRLTPLAVKELGSACSLLAAGVAAGMVRHIGQVPLSAAVSVAAKRRLGDTGLWVWSRASAASDITPIQSATYALHGAQSLKTAKPTRSEGRRVVVLS